MLHMYEKIRVGVVGLGHRGREMFKLAAKGSTLLFPQRRVT